MGAGFCESAMSSFAAVGGFKLKLRIVSPRQRALAPLKRKYGSMFWTMCAQYSEASSMGKLRRLQYEKLQKRRKSTLRKTVMRSTAASEPDKVSLDLETSKATSESVADEIGVPKLHNVASDLGAMRPIRESKYNGAAAPVTEIAQKMRDFRSVLSDKQVLSVKNGLSEQTVRNRDSDAQRSSSMTIRRSCGELPRVGSNWSPGNGVANGVPSSDICLPHLSSFIVPISDSILSRTEGSLPRKGRRQATEPAAGKKATQHLRSANKQSDPILCGLDESQFKAVTTALARETMVLASPGSGKTRVLTHRVAHLVQNCGVHPDEILAVTFTNKAAHEMKWRIERLMRIAAENAGEEYRERRLTNVGTFHAICAGFLRIYGNVIGLEDSFQIVDQSGQLKAMAEALKALNMDKESSDLLKPDSLLAAVSKWKNNADYLHNAHPQWREVLVKVRPAYDGTLRGQNQLDFDDLLLETKRMLSTSSEALGILQDTHRYLLVDEWQDTNMVQYDILRLLASKHRNLFVVGDADQSIYQFRGADSRNIDQFMTDYPQACRYLLENNYRSSRVIVEAAQKVIEKNVGRPNKTMQTLNSLGRKIIVCGTIDDREEALYIANESTKLLKSGAVFNYNHIAVMYRTNAQSRPLEETFIKLRIPYRLIGGIRFYNRHEVKDVVGYLRVIDNPTDNHSLERILNVPSRGIGAKTIENLFGYANEKGLSGVQALTSLCESPDTGSSDGSDTSLVTPKQREKLSLFYEVYKSLCNTAKDHSVDKTVEKILKLPGFKEYVTTKIDTVKSVQKGMERWRNVEEVRSAASSFEDTREFLQYIVLMSTSNLGVEEDKRDQRGAITLMTIHGAKGCEYETVFICGSEDGLLPMLRGLDEEELEEERRLAFVGMTRAKNRLYMTHKKNRRSFGPKGPSYAKCRPSRFLHDIPPKLMTVINTPELAQRSMTGDG